jgi:type I restriction enzyme M protein
VKKAMAHITKRGTWTDPQRKWLERIGKAVEQVGVADGAVLDEGQFAAEMGGFNRLNVLRDDGITYQAYVTELTFLLFLKMMQETEREDALPKSYRWRDLTVREGEELLTHYRALLLKLGTGGIGSVRDIFTDAQTSLREPTNLKTLVSEIDKLDWFSARREGLGDLYEGLLERNAGEKKSGAGQYFTPRPLIDCLVRLLKPKPGEIIQDPAAGTGAFLVASDRFIKDATDDLFNLRPEQQAFQRTQAFVGLELVLDAHLCCL